MNRGKTSKVKHIEGSGPVAGVLGGVLSGMICTEAGIEGQDVYGRIRKHCQTR